MATRKVPLEKKADTKYMQVNVLRDIASMTKRQREVMAYELIRLAGSVLMR